MEILNFLSFGHWNVFLTPGDSTGITNLVIFICVFLVAKLGRLILVSDSKDLKGKYLGMMVPIRILVLLVLYGTPLAIVSWYNALWAVYTMLMVELVILVITFIVIVAHEFDDRYYFYFNKWLMTVMRDIQNSGADSDKIKCKINNINKEINDYREKSLIR